MKALVFLLVFVNLLFYAYTEGVFGRSGNPDAARVEQQLVPERIRIVARGDQPPPKRSNGAEIPPSRSDEPEELCLSWARLPAAEADQLASTLAERFAGVRVERRAVASEGSGWWVFIPPQPSKAEADRKAGELKELGVKDYFVVQDAGPSQFAISLGVFSGEKGGQDRLAELKAKGVKSAKAAPRPGKETLFSLEARGPALLQEGIQGVAAEIVPKAETQVCK